MAALKQVLSGMDQRMASFDERLKRVESQMAVFRQAIRNAPPVERSSQGVGLAVNYVYRPGGQGEFKPLTDGGVMRSGDHYKIIFTPETDGYVYLFQTDSSGQIYRLFPLDSFKGVAVNLANPVKAGVTYYVPAQGQSFRLDQQRGPEKFYFLVSRERDAVLEFQHRPHRFSETCEVLTL